ncbi:MAG: hypothetical protein U0U69_04500 [Acidimicrobiia bacterium]
MAPKSRISHRRATRAAIVVAGLALTICATWATGAGARSFAAKRTRPTTTTTTRAPTATTTTSAPATTAAPTTTAPPVTTVPPATPPPVAPVVVPGTVTPALPWRPFASTSAWNTPIAADTLTDADSAAIVAALTTDPSKIAADLYEYGTPVYEADAPTPRQGHLHDELGRLLPDPPTRPDTRQRRRRVRQRRPPRRRRPHQRLQLRAVAGPQDQHHHLVGIVGAVLPSTATAAPHRSRTTPSAPASPASPASYA